MWKKLILIVLIILLAGAAFIGWRFFLGNTPFEEKRKFLYIRTGHANYEEVLQTIKDSNFVRNPGSFDFLARRLDLPELVKPGKYEITKGMSLSAIVRMLRNGQQSPVNLVVTKVRTKEDLAGIIGRRFECDSASVMAYMSNEDTLRHYGFDANTIMATVYPNTYTYFWNTTPPAIFKKLFAEYKKVWTPERLQQAQALGLSPVQVYTFASIIEEETQNNSEKDTMASVYINRFRSGMPLQADPTVKFALRDFTLKRIYEKHLQVESPYNTYRNKGLPPGPICTPSLITLDKVLQSPNTKYLYFVVSPDLTRHIFTENYKDHMTYAREFHKSMDERARRKAAQDSSAASK
ncbi:endolytic transglycosylase MltG [Paraflavitalea pollutisoli]|uniref:endolytic transglycosylase MltG n=1 Tax=Paraflavitalea pollutisoli TaxID=3034143 RepID=UPI0023EC9628|nr:endolytic transglycosylase MltG [Paraflavitalea sp. H1-2-19X]